jgi:hypothetical protein
MQVFPAQFSIGPVNLAPATVLAPMAGVTDTVFRRFIRKLGGCGLIMTEFTSSHGVSASLKTRKPNKTLQRYLSFDPDETSDLRPALRRRPHASWPKLRARLPGSGLRHPRSELRLPRQQGRQV